MQHMRENGGNEHVALALMHVSDDTYRPPSYKRAQKIHSLYMPRVGSVTASIVIDKLDGYLEAQKSRRVGDT